ncbi:Glucose-repressible alcohol dehydrogenase transcriptional effector [Stygiomarasmius scandens]|uniref:Glucose-repressible alcohol dehydrogenase transcriptional effector n=1 Tax=Marasmiellus scandens TaxID=2682957 RepID=A0ABR1J3L1_9AGAR
MDFSRHGRYQHKNLPSSSGPFSFAFLYLNHNVLQSIPPEISKLHHLELLDLSGNALESLPPELGMLVNLKELYIFDNRIQSPFRARHPPSTPDLGYRRKFT